MRAPLCPNHVIPRGAIGESDCLEIQPQSSGKFHPRLNIGERPTTNKYCEEKMERNLKRESNILEIIGREVDGSRQYPSIRYGMAKDGISLVSVCRPIRIVEAEHPWRCHLRNYSGQHALYDMFWQLHASGVG